MPVVVCTLMGRQVHYFVPLFNQIALPTYGISRTGEKGVARTI